MLYKCGGPRLGERRTMLSVAPPLQQLLSDDLGQSPRELNIEGALSGIGCGCGTSGGGAPAVMLMLRARSSQLFRSFGYIAENPCISSLANASGRSGSSDKPIVALSSTASSVLAGSAADCRSKSFLE